MQDGDISPTEFRKVLQEVERYRRLKADIRNQAKAKVKQITKEQREGLLEQGRKKGKKIFYEKSQTLQVSRVSVPSKIWSSSALQRVILWSKKTIKTILKFVFPIVESTSGCNISPVLPSIIVSPSITIFFWSPSHASFLTVSSINLWSYTFWSMICCFWSSSRHATQAGVSKLKIILLYFVMVSLWLIQALLLFSCSFDRVYTTFLQVLTKTSCSFIISLCNRRQVTKIFLTFLHLKNQSSSINILHCWFSASVYLHFSTYTQGW